MRFGDFLLNRKIVTEDALAEALEIQRYKRIKIGRLLRDFGHLSQDGLNAQLYAFLHQRQDTSLKALASILKSEISQGTLTLKHQKWAQERDCELLSESEEGLLFMGTSFRDELLEAAEDVFKTPCDMVVVDLDGLRFVRSEAGLIEDKGSASITLETQATDDQKIGTPGPYTQLFRDALIAALKKKASDIHIDPTREGVEIRFRVLGDMHTWKTLGLEHRRPFINEVKRIVNLSIATRGMPQDSRVSFDSWHLDLRVSLLPSIYDESLVFRLLDRTRKFELSKTGLDEQTVADLLEVLRYKNGVLIISGPTGSGKTTTLCSMLCSLDRKSKNIVTLENPVEYRIDGLRQVEANRKFSFADALRAVLRQDPDVILVGEIRDAETADLCIKAASTGHLVLSTLHANGAAEVIGRLTNLGVDPYILRSVLRFSAAQRLVQKLCPLCALEPSNEDLKEFEQQFANRCRNLKLPDLSQLRKRNKQGCPNCVEHPGIVDRLPLLEYMQQDQISRYLASQNHAQAELSVSLKDAVMRSAEKGDVDYRDVFEVE